MTEKAIGKLVKASEISAKEQLPHLVIMLSNDGQFVVTGSNNFVSVVTDAEELTRLKEILFLNKQHEGPLSSAQILEYPLLPCSPYSAAWNRGGADLARSVLTRMLDRIGYGGGGRKKKLGVGSPPLGWPEKHPWEKFIGVTRSGLSFNYVTSIIIAMLVESNVDPNTHVKREKIAEENIGNRGDIIAEENIENQGDIIAEENIENQGDIIAEENIASQGAIIAEENIGNQVAINAEENIGNQGATIAEENIGIQVAIIAEQNIGNQEVITAKQNIGDQVAVTAKQNFEFQVTFIAEQSIEDQTPISAGQDIGDQVVIIAEQNMGEEVDIIADQYIGNQVAEQKVDKNLEDQVKRRKFGS